MKLIDQKALTQKMTTRISLNSVAKIIFFIGTLIGLIFLAALFYRIISQGAGNLNWQFLNGLPSISPEKAGIKNALMGSLWLILVTAPVTLIIGVSTSIYLEEYAKQNALNRFIQANIQNLAGVPSIVFGLLGLTIFVYVLNTGKIILAGGLTLSLLVLPVIVVASQEAIRSIPKELREASYAMGATKWQTVLRIVLPAAVPGILTGAILALSRAIGETAPILVVGASTAIFTMPNSVFDPYTAMPIQIFNWVGLPNPKFEHVASAGIIVLLIVLLLMNTVAVIIRNKFTKRY